MDVACIPCEPPTETVIASTPAAELLAPDPPPLSKSAAPRSRRGLRHVCSWPAEKLLAPDPPPKLICSPPLPEGPPTCLQLAGDR